MFDEELPKKTSNEFPRDLENMSINEIAEYIAELQAESVRAENDMKAKKASGDAANSFFK